jgi:uncharacterized membrane protein YqjE
VIEDDGEVPDETPGPSWGQRLRDFFEALAGLLSTRAAIFREELGGKAASLGRALVAFFFAAAFAWLSLLLLTAGIAALLSSLFGSAILGILVTFVLYAAVAGLAAYLGVMTVWRVDFTFPVTGEEIRKDWQAIAHPPSAEPADPAGPEEVAARRPGPSSPDDLEARFRVGSE